MAEGRIGMAEDRITRYQREGLSDFKAVFGVKEMKVANYRQSKK